MSITKLILNVNNHDITVSFEEAKKLYQELHEIFGAKPYPINIRNPEEYPPKGNPRTAWPLGIDPSKFTD